MLLIFFTVGEGQGLQLKREGYSASFIFPYETYTLQAYNLTIIISVIGSSRERRNGFVSGMLKAGPPPAARSHVLTNGVMPGLKTGAAQLISIIRQDSQIKVMQSKGWLSVIVSIQNLQTCLNTSFERGYSWK